MEDNIVQAFTNPAHFVLAVTLLGLVGAGYYFSFPFLFERKLRKSMNNGWGNDLKNMVKLALGEAMKEQHEKLEQTLQEREDRADAKIAAAVGVNAVKIHEAFEAHERVEKAEIQTLLTQVRSEDQIARERIYTKLETGDERFGRIEEQLKELAKKAA